MESPFHTKDEQTENNVFSSTISVQQQATTSTSTENRELVSSTISVPIVQDTHEMIVMNQEARVALPSLMTNSHEQSTTQEGLTNEMGENMNMYPQYESNVLLYAGQQLENERSNNLPGTEELKANDDSMDEGKKKLDNTLVGKIIGILRQEGRPMRKEEIQMKIGSSFDALRKSDGTKYKGDRGKALNGALYSTGIFHRENDQWSIRESELDSYERKMRLRLESKGKRKRMGDDPSDDGSKRRYSKKHIKKSTVVKMLKDVTDKLRRSNNPEVTNSCFKNPFQGLTGTEEIIKIRKKLGDEKFEMAIQMYVFFEEALDRLMKEDDPTVTTISDEQTARIIDQLQKEVMSLKNQLTILEHKMPDEL